MKKKERFGNIMTYDVVIKLRNSWACDKPAEYNVNGRI